MTPFMIRMLVGIFVGTTLYYLWKEVRKNAKHKQKHEFPLK
ncbi:hypothetical protein [Priestia flexa]|nr:hypothetical protein [Priestia flexa]